MSDARRPGLLSAEKREDALDRVLPVGPIGLGKTTLAELHQARSEGTGKVSAV